MFFALVAAETTCASMASTSAARASASSTPASRLLLSGDALTGMTAQQVTDA
jgi:hypothetical protein